MGKTMRGKKGKRKLSPLDEEMLEILSPSSDTQEEIPEYKVVEAVYVPPSETVKSVIITKVVGEIKNETSPIANVEKGVRDCRKFLSNYLR